MKWQSLGGGNMAIHCVGEEKSSWSRLLLNQRCMAFVENHGTVKYSGYLSLRDDFIECDSREEVVSRVRSDVAAIGFCGYMSRLRSVKILSIAQGNDKDTAISPSGDSIQLDYPFAETIVLYIHPDAIKKSEGLPGFAYLRKVQRSAQRYGLVTPWHEKQTIIKKRLSELKSGKGVRVSAIGSGVGGKAVSDLAVEYVKAKAVVQMGYLATDSDVAAVGLFVRAGAEATSMPASVPAGSPAISGAPGAAQAFGPAAVSPFVAAGGKELLLLADRPSKQAMKLHGQKWNALAPGGTGPKEYVIAGRAAAIIVNKANKLESLTLGQLQAIFGGEMDNWAMAGDTGFSPAAGPSGKLEPVRITAWAGRATLTPPSPFKGEGIPRRPGFSTRNAWRATSSSA